MGRAMNSPTPTILFIWALLALCCVIGIALAVRAEGRHFRQRQHYQEWFWLRLATLLIVVLSLIPVLLVSRSISGMEALAGFYLMLLLIVPPLYFGLHLLLGSLLGLRSGQSMQIAGSGLLVLLGVPITASTAQPWVFGLAQRLDNIERKLASNSELPYQLIQQRRLRLPKGGELISQHWQVKGTVKLTRIDLQLGTQILGNLDHYGSLLCRSHEDLHLLWPASEPAPQLQLYWRQGFSLLRTAQLQPQAGTERALSFQIDWQAQQVQLPVRLPRNAVTLGWQRRDGTLDYDSLNHWQPGETFADQCLPLSYARAPEQPGSRLAALRLRLSHSQAGLPEEVLEFYRD